MSALTENHRVKFIINVIFYALCAALIYLALRYIPGLFMPFILALIIVLATNPLVNLVERKLKIPRKIGGPVIVLIVIGLLIVLAFFLVNVVFSQAVSLVKQISDILKSVPAKFAEISESYNSFLDRIEIPQAIVEAFDFNKIADTIVNAVLGFFDISAITSVLFSNVTSFLLSFFIMVVATVLLSADYIRVRSFVMRQLSVKRQKTVSNIKVFMKTTVWGYTKTYAVIFAFYFVSMLIILLIMRVDYAALISFFIALVDLLPIVGLGAVLIPWAIISFISGNAIMGVVLIVSYIVLSLARNMIEPKLIGKQVGLHPLITLIALYIGLKLFGIIGVFVVPISVIMVKSEHDAGRLHIWKD